MGPVADALPLDLVSASNPVPPSLSREKAPKEKSQQPALRQPRQGPTDEAQMAAAAALARLEQKQPRSRGPTSQDSIRNQVRKELQAEATSSSSPDAPGTKSMPETKEEGSGHLAVNGVYFTCPLTGATLRRDQRDARIREAIMSHFTTDPVAASIMKIHTFNRDRDRVKLGVDTIAKYLDNIHLHPEEEKYRKIKLQNKVFQERINCLEGTHEFLEAIGFQRVLLPVADQALYQFVRESLQSDWLPFELLASGGHKLVEEETPAFKECGLVPSALLTFAWDAAVLEDIRAAGTELDSSVLKPELLEAMEKLS
ncbi:PREDICTED: UBX domain-containing protein 6 [Dipodomys ordii]|uniref:UBX domain-containing protein 6 n=1 Tax=Dipodomys ordii TaxID=10020 RepID=A0A1S3FNF4_DIPOR|nr:PREDICTED: UBX domain-containing protein 6 [Dipodomys ordii]